MSLFRYRFRWEPSRSFCVIIIQSGNRIKELSLSIRGNLGKTPDLFVGRDILRETLEFIEELDKVIFSAGSLLYREEKKMIGFLDKVSSEIKKKKRELGKHRGKYNMLLKKLESMNKKLDQKKAKLIEISRRKAEKEGKIIFEDEKTKGELIGFLSKLKTLIFEIDRKINDVNLGAKAQARGTLNIHTARENMAFRSSIRLGELIGRKGIEIGALLKDIDGKLKVFKRILRKGKTPISSEEEKLVRECSLEANDLKNIFEWVLQESKKAESYLIRLKRNIPQDSNISKNPKLNHMYTIVKSRLSLLRRDIETQFRRLNNEVNKKKLISPRIEQEIKKPRIIKLESIKKEMNKAA